MNVLVRFIGLPLLFLCLSVAACGGEPDAASAETAAEASDESLDYQLFLRGALSDTLRGQATFGRVLHTRDQQERFIIVFRTGRDFNAELFLVSGSAERPSAGTYPLAAEVEEGDAERFRMVYRRGMLRQLVSTEGRLTLEVVNDTLVRGTIDAALHGRLTTGAGEQTGSNVQATGRFEAHAGAVGYVMGL